MKKLLKSSLALIMLVALFASLAINSSAAWVSYKKTAGYASQELVDVTCNYRSLKKDSFTVRNSGNVAMFVYVNGCYAATIDPGEFYTCTPNHNFKDRVQVYAKRSGFGYQKISISSTSGVIYNS